MDNICIEDLSRALVREFLFQNKLLKTYECLENQDKRGCSKMTKSTLIRNLCLENLVFANKKSHEPLNSLLEILVNYLKNKFLKKKQTKDKSMGKTGSVTSENFYFHQPLDETIKTNNLNQIKQNTVTRPGSARRPLKPEPLKPLQTTHKTKTLNRFNTSDSNKMGNQPQQTVEQRIEQIPNEIPVAILAVEQEISKPQQQPIQPPHPLSKTVSEGAKINQPVTVPSSVFVPVPQPKQQKMISMFGKRKQKQMDKQKLHSIFSTPLEQQVKQIKYQYNPMKFEKLIIKQQITTDLTYKKVPNNEKNKKKAKPIQEEMSMAARKLLFQGQAKALPKAWKQGVILSPFSKTYYGLQQIQGGPCGIIAALQCYFLKHLFYFSKYNPTSEQVRQNCAVAAIADMLYTINPQRVILTIPSILNAYAKDPVSVEDLEIITINQPKGLQQIYEVVYNNKSYFFGQTNSGYSLLLYSCILTKGIDAISKQMDNSQSSLIGNHGHCNQQLVNLFITGKASTNVFNGTKVMQQDQDKIEFKGISEKAKFGFLTVFQSLGYIEVGSNLKNPKFPIWIICKQFHYHVVFGGHYLIAENNKTQKFDLVYFDGLYNCADQIILTLGEKSSSTDKITNLPLIEQVLLTKWGRRDVDWNGSIKIL